MSLSQRQYEARRWLATAGEDLAAARDLERTGHHAQACFFAQQAGEKAVKALWCLHDLDPWGHSVQKLVKEFPEALAPGLPGLVTAGAALDKYYVATRYPNGLPDLTPGQCFGPDDAEQALRLATRVLTVIAPLFPPADKA